MAFKCVYAARECTGCMSCLDVEPDVPFDEPPLSLDELEDDEVDD